MYGFPKRINRQRRILPTTAQFDSSGDPSCSGWWRADSNVIVSNANKSLVNGWASKLPSALGLVGPAGSEWLRVEALTNGWPGLIGWNMDNWNTSGIAQAGDRSFTYTFVLRSIRTWNNNNWLIGLNNMLGIGLWDGYLRPLHPYVSWWPVIDGWYYPNGTANVLSEANSLRIYGYGGGFQFWHEVVTFRRCLSDTEILDMHTALLTQYGAI